jgi:hypothetical protein
MFFDGFENFPDAKINPTLFWEYDYAAINYAEMREVIVQRVIERGWPDDWYAMLNVYGVDEVKRTIKNLPYLNDKDLNFVSKLFDIPLTNIKCYGKKQSASHYWNS